MSTTPAANAPPAGSPFVRWLGLAPGQRGGGIADLVLLATNLVFLTPVAGWFGSLVAGAIGDNDPLASRQLALLLSTAVVFESAGAYLKRRPLQARLAQSKHGSAGCATTWLLLFTYILNLLIGITIVALLGLSQDSPLPIFAAAVLAFVPVYLFHRALSPPKAQPHPSWLDSPQAEWCADLFLLAYVVVNTLFFNLLTGYKASPPTSFDELFTHLLSLFVVIGIALIWYLPPRLLFLVEDFQERGTWIRIVVAMSPIALRWVLG